MSNDRYEELARALDEDGDPGIELLAGLYPSVAELRSERNQLHEACSDALSEGEDEMLLRAVRRVAAAEAGRDRLQARVVWLRRAYGKAWLRRWSLQGIIRDVNAARLSAKAERDELRDRLSHELCVGQDVEGELHDAKAERDRLRKIVKDVPGIVEKAVRDLQGGRWPARGRELANDPDTIRDIVSEALTALDVSEEGT